MNPEEWRRWAQSAPEWAFQFFGGVPGSVELEPLVDRHGPIGDLEHLLEAIEDAGTRITIIIEPEGEY